MLLKEKQRETDREIEKKKSEYTYDYLNVLFNDKVFLAEKLVAFSHDVQTIIKVRHKYVCKHQSPEQMPFCFVSIPKIYLNNRDYFEIWK